MAQAKTATQMITVKTVSLTLNEDEARTLAAILRHVGGDETLSPRRHASAIARALAGTGVVNESNSERRLIRSHASPNGLAGIVFKNYGDSAYLSINEVRAAEGMPPRMGRAWGSI
jgi:hypothetical protein